MREAGGGQAPGRGRSGVRDGRRVARERRAPHPGACPTVPGCADCPPGTGR